MRFNLTLIALLLYGVLQAQSSDSTLTRLQKMSEEKDQRVLVVPSIYYTPETNWYFGLGMYGYFKTDKADTTLRVSQIRGALGYTLNQQIVFWLPGEFYFKSNKYRLLTELGFYRWPYEFNGIGNSIDTFYTEPYSATFPRIRFSLQQQVIPNLFVGPRYWIQSVNMNQIEKGGLLENNMITGYQGGLTSGLGLTVLYDNRDYVLAPTSGFYAEASSLHNFNFIGSDFSFSTLVIDLRGYLKIKKDHMLAAQLYGKFNSGNPPFNQMSLLGGAARLRGYREGRYRDLNLVSSQIEYRSAFYKDFMGIAVFAGAGMVSNQLSGFSTKHLRSASGAGFRFLMDPENRLTVRIDYAVGQGKENRQFYFTLSEAF